MKKILLIPGNTDLNRGDQALVWESINLIKEIYDEPDIILMRGDDYRQYEQTERLGYRFVDNILRHPGRVVHNNHIRYSKLDLIIIGFRALLDLIESFLLLVPCKFVNSLSLAFLPSQYKATYKEFSECDAIYVKGGGFIHSYGSVIDPYQMYYLLFNILLGLRFKKNVFILPNSIGPFKNKIAARLAIQTLNRCKYISVRESVSKSFLEGNRNIKVPVYRHSDLGYYLKASSFNSDEYLKQHGVNINRPKVAITLRPYRFPGANNPKELYKTYIDSFVKFSKYIEGKGYQVVLCAHTLGPGAHENDTIAINEVAALLDETKTRYVKICDESLNCQDVMALYSSFDYLVGTRFHSVIFAQNSLVPTIAISYGGNKGIGIMEDLSLSEYSIPMNSVVFKELVAIFENLEENKVNVVQKLKQFRDRIKEDRFNLITEIKSVTCEL